VPQCVDTDSGITHPIALLQTKSKGGILQQNHRFLYEKRGANFQ